MLATLIAVSLVTGAGVHPGAAAFGDVHGDAIVAGVYVDDTTTVTDCVWSPAFPRDAHGTSSDEVVRYIGSRAYVLYECDCDGDVTLHWIPEVDTDKLADQAAQTLSRRVPSPIVGMAPPPGAGVVNTTSWFWVSAGWWVPISVTAMIPTPRGPLGVTTTATPTTLRFDPGDGSATVTCDGPGVPYAAPLHHLLSRECTHRWSRPSVVSGGRFATTLSVVWKVRWRATTGASGNLPDITTSVNAPVLVDELHAVARRATG